LMQRDHHMQKKIRQNHFLSLHIYPTTPPKNATLV
jgi:hypothetical protein